MNKLKSVITVFLTGISVTGLEVASARIVSPFFGSTIYVWGGAIGTVLAALALGYWLGGKVIDRYPNPKAVMIVLLVAAVSTLLVPWVFVATGNMLSDWSFRAHIPVGIAVMAMMIMLFLVPVVAMGMVSPMVLRLSLVNIQQAGSWSGLLSGAATAGSILGTFLSAYVTVPYAGTRLTIIGAAALLLATAFLAAWPRRAVLVAIISGLAVTGSLALTTPYVPKKELVFERESPYQLIHVIERQEVRYLVHDTGRGYQSSYQPGASYTPSAYDVFGLLPYISTSETRTRKVLLIGLGGGNMIRLYHDLMADQFDFSLTAVEIDQAVVDVAKQYFDLARIPMTIITDDARHFLRYDQDRYDIIIVDAYTHEMQIPVMLATNEFFAALHQRLAPDGVLGINALAFPTSRYYDKFVQTVANNFSQTYAGPFTPASYNKIIIAGDRISLDRFPASIHPVVDLYLAQTLPGLRPVAQGAGDIYTDDRTDLDVRVRPFLD